MSTLKHVSLHWYKCWIKLVASLKLFPIWMLTKHRDNLLSQQQISLKNLCRL
uniref:Macaca fascicularis brain cDNA clone: QmoA-12272, similar to human Rho GTPase activating protein 5 (ARHGAP5), mRNA, RefSeq: NM_001173.1 n=1 Tax=Macaca fascicularis TaxID=9541 RepID=I7G2W0_MACFA|nr:unnamed protein product [Macaca fascicularis]